MYRTFVAVPARCESDVEDCSVERVFWTGMENPEKDLAKFIKDTENKILSDEKFDIKPIETDLKVRLAFYFYNLLSNLIFFAERVFYFNFLCRTYKLN